MGLISSSLLSHIISRFLINFQIYAKSFPNLEICNLITLPQYGFYSCFTFVAYYLSVSNFFSYIYVIARLNIELSNRNNLFLERIWFLFHLAPYYITMFLIIFEIYATSFYNLGISILIILLIICLVLFSFWSHIIFLFFQSRESVLITFSCYGFSIFLVFVAHYFSSLNFFQNYARLYIIANDGSAFDHGT